MKKIVLLLSITVMSGGGLMAAEGGLPGPGTDCAALAEQFSNQEIYDSSEWLAAFGAFASYSLLQAMSYNLSSRDCLKDLCATVAHVRNDCFWIKEKGVGFWEKAMGSVKTLREALNYRSFAQRYNAEEVARVTAGYVPSDD